MITYKDEHGQPQFWADLSNWSLASEVPMRSLPLLPPDGADRIQFMAEIGSTATTAAPKNGRQK